MATLKTKIPDEIESVYQFIDETAYRVVKDLSAVTLEVSGKLKECHRLVSINAGSKDDVIKRFLGHDTDRPVSDSLGVVKAAQKEDEYPTTNGKPSEAKADNIAPPRGRPKKEFPVDNILQLATDGRSEREISRLTKIPRRTINRIIAGQRGLL